MPLRVTLRCIQDCNADNFARNELDLFNLCGPTRIRGPLPANRAGKCRRHERFDSCVPAAPGAIGWSRRRPAAKLTTVLPEKRLNSSRENRDLECPVPLKIVVSTGPAGQSVPKR